MNCSISYQGRGNIPIIVEHTLPKADFNLATIQYS